MVIQVAVVGATGYAGGEILRLLLSHPAYSSGDLRIGSLMGNSSAGQTGAEAFPHLPELATRTIEKMDIGVLSGHDVVFLALPHGHSAKVARAVGDSAIILDCAADFRLKNKVEWDAYYGENGSIPYPGSWPYGIPELPGQREIIKNSKHVAVPGCFPTGATLALYPAVQEGFIQPNINVTSITGVSGAGKSPNVAMLGAETMGSLKAYGTGGKHRHTPEIVQNLQEFTDEKVQVNFTPVLAPLPRGILTVASAPLAVKLDAETPEKIRLAYEEAYANERFVRLLPEGIQPQTQHIVGSNMCHVQVEINPHTETLLVTAAIDNLTKGTAGAAVQCMNLMLGFEENAGLTTNGVAP